MRAVTAVSVQVLTNTVELLAGEELVQETAKKKSKFSTARGNYALGGRGYQPTRCVGEAIDVFTNGF